MCRYRLADDHAGREVNAGSIAIHPLESKRFVSFRGVSDRNL